MLEGENSVDVEAPCQTCFDLAAALDRAPEWQTQVRSAKVYERDGEGRPSVVETVSDARVREIKYRLKYAYDPPHRISWTYLDGDVKDIRGEYRFEELDNSHTRVTYRLEVDPGRRLGLLLRGPLADKVRDYVMGTTLDELKAEAERR